jgi:hypothetical protein
MALIDAKTLPITVSGRSATLGFRLAFDPVHCCWNKDLPKMGTGDRLYGSDVDVLDQTMTDCGAASGTRK